MSRIFPYLISGIIIITFLFSVDKLAVNQPSFDDYDATFQTLQRYLQAPDFLQKLSVLFLPHNEHLIVSSRGLSILYFHLTGNINFRNLILLQQFFLLGVYVLTLALARRSGLVLRQVIVAVTLLYFSFSLWQVGFFYWSGIQHFSVIFFLQLSLLLLDRATGYTDLRFWGAWAAGAAAICCFGSGILALPLGGFLLFFQQKKRLLWGWATLLAAVGLLLWLRGPSGSMQPLHVVAFAKTFLAFSGNIFFLHGTSQAFTYTNAVLCLLAGAGLLWAALSLTFRGVATRRPLLYAFLLLPTLCGLLVALLRHQGNVAAGLAPRYAFFATGLPLALLLLTAADNRLLTPLRLRRLTLGLAVWWGISAGVHLRALQDFTSDITRRLENWQHAPGTPLVYYDPQQVRYSQLLQWAIGRGIWQALPGKQADENTDHGRADISGRY